MFAGAAMQQSYYVWYRVAVDDKAAET